MKKKNIKYILLIVLLSIFIIVVLFPKNKEIVKDKNNKIEPVKESVEYRDKPITKQILHNPNNRIIIDNILDKRLMDDDGEYYYLNHNLEGRYDEVGVPFVDYRTNFETRKTLIYAHSTLAGNGPFQVLQNYHNNKAFYDEHKYIDITYNDKEYHYEIFSVALSLADNEKSPELEYFHTTEYYDSDWEKIIQWYKSKSEYDTGVEVSKTDKILILQTCILDPDYYEKYYRYNILIFAKKI